MNNWVIPAATCLALIVSGCSESKSDSKPAQGENIVLSASNVPTVTIPTPTVVAQARLASSAAVTGVDAVASGDASMTAGEIEKRLKALNFSPLVKTTNLVVFGGKVDGQDHLVSVAEGRTTISAMKGYTNGGRYMLEKIQIRLIMDHVESISDEWSVVVGELPANLANLPYIQKPATGALDDDSGLVTSFITDRLVKFDIQLPLQSERPADERPYIWVAKCYSREGAALSGTDCKDVIAQYAAYYFIDSLPERSCRGQVCKLGLSIQDNKLESDILEQLRPAAKAAFVEKFGEPEPDKK